jgi:hypothetical protein
LGIRSIQWLTGAAIALAGGVLLGSGNGRPNLAFVDVAEQAGIRAKLHNGDPARRWITEANGTGLAWIDYDNDGLLDLVIVNGGDMGRLRRLLAGAEASPVSDGIFLFHNLGQGRFEDVTAKAGLINPYWGTGVNAADYDNDGWPDLLVTTIGRDLLFHNNGNGSFSEVGQRAGLSRSVAWHTGSAFGDFDRDGRLDLFITGYVDVRAMKFDDPAPVCDYQGQHVFCGPIGLKGEHSVLYRNNGDGTFSDVTSTSGIGKAAPAHGFTVLTGDFNEDGKLDFLVANDSDPNYLFLNNGDRTFRESALDEGIAFNADGRTQSNMGVTAGDLEGNGRLDVLTTTFRDDYFPLFRKVGSRPFEEVAPDAGVARVTSNYFGWACGLADFDNSGMRDFWTANGHVYPTDKRFKQPVTVFRVRAGGNAELAYSYPKQPDNSYRGGATADFDNDGKLDLAVVPLEGSPVMLKNVTTGTGHWMGIKLEGTLSGRDAIGAKVRVEACSSTQEEELRSGGSYVSRSDPRLHFGFGNCSTVDSVSVKWPSGQTTTLRSPHIDTYVTIQEPKPN